MELERLNQQQFQQFRDFIYQESGIRIDEQKVTLLSNRVRRRVKAGEFENFDAYYRYIKSAAGKIEVEGFLDAVTTNETFFFRTPKHFDWFRDNLIAELVAQHRVGTRSASLRVWSAGCANGAEPYSIAICLASNMHRLRGWSLKIVGTDISEEMLRAAREGVFSPKAVELVAARERRRYFHYLAKEDRWQIRPEIKRWVEFKGHNLMRPLPEPAFDCIFIRNVLIYFDRKSKQIALRNLITALAVGGYLVVGPSEGVYDMVGPLQKAAPLVYQKVDDNRADGQAIDSGNVRP